MRRTYRIFSLLALLMLIQPPAVAEAAQPSAGTRIDLRVLVVSRGDSTTGAIADQLASEGVPYDVLDLTSPDRPTVNAAFLADEVDGVERARYQAIVLPDANPFTDPAEYAALADYRREHGIPQVDAFVWPSSAVGLGSPAYSGTLDGFTATVTGAGRAGGFGYLRGGVPFEDNDPALWESYGYLSQPSPSPGGNGHFEPLLTAAIPPESGGGTGMLAGEYTVDGRRELVLTFAYYQGQEQFRLLAPGIVEWLTGGVHLGYFRNYLSVHVDDVLLPDSRWSVAGNCTPGDDCLDPGYTTTDIRMEPADVAYAESWQASRDFTLDLLFNAAGSVEATNDGGGPDPLTDALLAARTSFRWTNHTYGHEFLGCVQDFSVRPWRCATDPVGGVVSYASQALIEAEIGANLAWAATNDLPVDPGELVTGEHSGMRLLPQQPDDNPNLAPALAAAGIGWLGGDNSRDRDQRRIGTALTVPRHPMNVFYNVATAAEEVDEYNWIYTSRADGGSGVCGDHPETVTCIEPLDPATGYQATIVPVETRIALSHVLGNDPRPHFVHQSNLAEERIIYPLLDSILSRYRAAFADTTPVVSQRLAANGLELRRQAAWGAGAAAVTAYLLDGVVTIEAPAGIDVPVTVPEGTRLAGPSGPLFGEPYAGARSGYHRTGGPPTTLVLP
jgi:hypothetical protein